MEVVGGATPSDLIPDLPAHMFLPATLCLAAAILPQDQGALPPIDVVPPIDTWQTVCTDNLRWKFDVSARGFFDDSGYQKSLGFFGLDLHKVFSTDDQDWATLLFQPYLTRANDLVPTPPVFDGPDDTELIWRIANLNVKLLQDGSANLRVGHFELPYGLEQTLNTNGTLRDYTHGGNFGLKADWGVTLNGDLEELEYEFAWSRGSGNEYKDEGGPGVLSGRIGSPRDDANVFGLSFADGEFQTPGGLVQRSRLGLDAQIYRGAFGYFAEVSAGEDRDTVDVVRALGELNWRSPDETVLAWLQLVGTQQTEAGARQSGLTSLMGVRWEAAHGWSLSTQYTQVLEPFQDGGPHAGSLTLQLRYRF